MNRPVRQKQPRIKNKKLTNSAKGENCTLRIPGICNFNPETTVFAHMNGGGMGYKHHDIHGCYACSDCHDWLDKGWVNNVAVSDVLVLEQVRDSEFFRAMIETQNRMIEKGLIKF